MQRFVNDPDYIVEDMVKGYVKAHKDLIKRSEANDRVVQYVNAPVEGKVGLVTGGGSGHEPAFLGYVGKNMMDAVAVGEIFSSPSAQAFYDAFMSVDSGQGVACLFGNYAGDNIGHHGEPGINVQDLKPAKDIARQMAKAVIDDMEPEEGSEVAVLMSGLGATPVMELYVLYDEVEEYLKEQGLSVYKVFIGDYVTSLDMNGAALTVLKLDDELKELLDYEAKSPGIEV